MQEFWGDTRTMLISGAVLAGVIGLALLVHFALFFAVERILERRGASAQTLVTRRARKSARIIFPLLALVLTVPPVPIPETLKNILQTALGLSVIASVGWGQAKLGDRFLLLEALSWLDPERQPRQVRLPSLGCPVCLLTRNSSTL